MQFTREKYRKVDLAKKKFETVVRGIARECGGAAEQQARMKLKHWRKNGMSLNEVKWSRVLYNDKAYKRYRTAERALKRQPWTGKRIKNAVSESAVREGKRQKKVDDVLSQFP